MLFGMGVVCCILYRLVSCASVSRLICNKLGWGSFFLLSITRKFVILFEGHYANMSVQYIAIFHGYKNDYFQMKKFNIFLIFAQNIDCGYTLEPPQ